MSEDAAERLRLSVLPTLRPARANLRALWDVELERRATGLLAEFCRDERAETFERLFEASGPALLPLFRMKLRRSRSRVDPAELLTDTFAQVYRARHQFHDRGPGSFVRWVLAIADNLLRQDARADRRRRRREELIACSIEDRSTDPFACVLRDEAIVVARLTYRELRRLVLEGMQLLPASQEQVLLLHAQERMSYAEIGARLGLSVGAVSMRLQRARERILAHLRERFDSLPTSDAGNGARP